MHVHLINRIHKHTLQTSLSKAIHNVLRHAVSLPQRLLVPRWIQCKGACKQYTARRSGDLIMDLRVPSALHHFHFSSSNNGLWLVALPSTRVIKCALIQVENRCYALKWIIKADVISWFCGRNHYKYEEFCTIGNYCGCELCTLICTRGECELHFSETAPSIGFRGKKHCKWRVCK